MHKAITLLWFAPMLTACAITSSPQPAGSTATANPITPTAAVMAAAARYPDGVSGQFVLTVQATGAADGNIYLNSELDYRDQRNLTVSIPIAVAHQLARQLGGQPATVLKGRKLLVSGVARV